MLGDQRLRMWLYILDWSDSLERVRGSIFMVPEHGFSAGMG